MSAIEEYPEVTNVSYQVLESNLDWNMRYGFGFFSQLQSKKTQIPLIDVEWYEVFL